MRDLKSHVTVKRLIAEASVTTSPTAVVIDRGSTNSNLYEGIVLAMHVGAGGITFTGANLIALKLEDSDDNVTFANVTAASSVVRSPVTAAAGGSTFGQDPDSNGYVRLINAAHASADTDPFTCAYVGNKRYLRVTIVFGGTHGSGTLVGLYGVLGFPSQIPAA